MSPPLHVEIVQKTRSEVTKEEIEQIVHSYLTNFASLVPGVTLSNHEFEENIELKEHVFSITFCNVEHETEVSMTDIDIVYHVYKLDSFNVETDTMVDATSGEEVSSADVWTLPSAQFYGLWENLIYDSKLKEDTLRFAETAFKFADRGVDPNVIGCNRVVLLHGPPGTGKTSLCRALAQKLAVRLRDRFPRARLFEINAHGLFSKWFSESGKLVAKLFKRIQETAEDQRLLLCVLVDEVESLAHSRRSALAGLEPSDSIRAVNAILTELDRLKGYPNALVLTTSNVTGAIDVAFVDRADIKRRVGPPSERAAYEILRGCCGELMSRGLVAPREHMFCERILEAARYTETEASRASLRLLDVARAAAAQRLSGRALRRLPFLAQALHTREDPNLVQFIEALLAALQSYSVDTEELDNHSTE